MRSGVDTTVQEMPSESLSDRAELPLHFKFAAVGSVVVVVVMLLIGSWVASEIEASVTRNSAISTALYMESFIAPLSQELSSQPVVSAETASKLNALAEEPHVADRIASIKLWRPGGLVVYALDPGLVGNRFEPSEYLKAAWKGELSAVFDDLNDSEDAAERESKLPLLEVYNPIYSIYTGEIIAVAEFYQIATELQNDIFYARLKSWVVVAGLSAAMFGILFGIVLRGSHLIEKQRRALEQRFEQLTQVSAQNFVLRQRIQSASAGVSELNERYLRRISADLHDGPAQSVALASLRMDSIGLVKDDCENSHSEVVRIKAALDEALSDIRNICRGLSLPEIEDMPIDKVVCTAVKSHEKRSRTTVALHFEGDPEDSYDHAAKICVFRFVQEALNNALHHGGGIGQSVRCQFGSGEVTIQISDDGPGFDLGDINVTRGLGLRGLRERIESHGGWFSIESKMGRGTSLTMTIDAQEHAHV